MSCLRGASLVDRVIEAGGKFSGGGLSEPEITNLTLNGKPLPPTLRSYLAFDTSLAEFDFEPTNRSQSMAREFEIFEKALPGECRAMRTRYTDCTLLLVYAGEYPVFPADIDDWYLVKIEHPGFDVFPANELIGGSPDEPAAAQSHLNYPGYCSLELFGEAATIDGKKTTWEGMPKPSYDDLSQWVIE